MREIMVGDQNVIIDPTILEFGETNLNEFLQKIGSHHAYFAERHADASWLVGVYEEKEERTYSIKFAEAKNLPTKPSDKLAEAIAKSDPEVIAASTQLLFAKKNRDLLNGHIRAIDKAFQAAMNYGYNKRKEMDKLNNEILVDADNQVKELFKGDRYES